MHRRCAGGDRPGPDHRRSTALHDQGDYGPGVDPSGNRRKLVATKTPGIYRRQNADGSPGAYVVVYRAGGRQRKEYARTLSEARSIKSARKADTDRGEFQARSKITLREFLTEWIDRYGGKARRGFREGTREEYRRLLDQYAHAYFGERLRLVDLAPHDLARYVAWLADPLKQGRRAAPCSPSSRRRTKTMGRPMGSAKRWATRSTSG
ncbi:MAG: hypothetical protein WKF72_09695 [Nocardioidaceae bacterium]